MGIPYSKQINLAFDQVTPLVAEGFQVLDTTKNIAVVLLWLEILSALIIALNLVCLVAVLITLNPDLEEERRALVTPAVRWVARETWKVVGVLGRWWIAVVVLGFGVYGLGLWMWFRHVGTDVEEVEGPGEEGQKGDGGNEKGNKESNKSGQNA
ncbi:uncharacterized protein B0I36DRAFT_50337 [Microdochium trichocladiopsis]|uniref:Uncharacterized protein n=1 Tax=Microdochium trichocladiopsis TaxID=1682393 RepID=A0A9P8XS60_9PEZI|nr:uncharacterized protein B0I36DRAFT_50337 [Microdochium trichocladiopsis]KAH7014525.1 hypothetical protein B0I36DRAFT_50337 [Microdochium trichocladiopsis]